MATSSTPTPHQPRVRTVTEDSHEDSSGEDTVDLMAFARMGRRDLATPIREQEDPFTPRTNITDTPLHQGSAVSRLRRDVARRRSELERVVSSLRSDSPERRRRRSSSTGLTLSRGGTRHLQYPDEWIDLLDDPQEEDFEEEYDSDNEHDSSSESSSDESDESNDDYSKSSKSSLDISLPSLTGLTPTNEQILLSPNGPQQLQYVESLKRSMRSNQERRQRRRVGSSMGNVRRGLLVKVNEGSNRRHGRRVEVVSR